MIGIILEGAEVVAHASHALRGYDLSVVNPIAFPWLNNGSQAELLDEVMLRLSNPSIDGT